MKLLLTKESRMNARTFLITITIILTAIFAALASPAVGAVNATVSGGNPDRIVLNFKFDSFTQRNVTINGQSYSEISLGKEAQAAVKGAPALPAVSRVTRRVPQRNHTRRRENDG